MPTLSELDRAYRPCERLRKALTEMRETRAEDLSAIERLTKEVIALRLRNDDLERNAGLPDSIKQAAMNSGDGSYHP